MAENINKLTALLLDLNEYCYSKDLELNIELKNKITKSIIKEVNKRGKKSIDLILNANPDDSFFNEVELFFNQLQSAS